MNATVGIDRPVGMRVIPGTKIVEYEMENVLRPLIWLLDTLRPCLSSPISHGQAQENTCNNSSP